MDRRTDPDMPAIVDVYAWHARTLGRRLDSVDHRTTVLCCWLTDVLGSRPWPDAAKAATLSAGVDQRAPGLEEQAVEARKVVEACEGLAEVLVGNPAPLDPAGEDSPHRLLLPVHTRARALEERCAALATGLVRLRALVTSPPYGWPPA